MGIDKLEDGSYGVFLYSEETRELVFTGSLSDCETWLFYNWVMA